MTMQRGLPAVAFYESKPSVEKVASSDLGPIFTHGAHGAPGEAGVNKRAKRPKVQCS